MSPASFVAEANKINLIGKRGIFSFRLEGETYYCELEITEVSGTGKFIHGKNENDDWWLPTDNLMEVLG